MDLHTAAQLSGKGWMRAKGCAFVCFALASALLVATLWTTPPEHVEAGMWTYHVTAPPR